MKLADSLTQGPDSIQPASRTKRTHPKGWEPTAVVKGNTATAIVPTSTPNPDHPELLSSMGLDPEAWCIIGDVEFRKWQQKPGDEWLYYQKFKAVSKQDLADPEWEEAKKLLLKHKVRRPKKRTVEHARVICLADWQVGKGEGGGSVALAERISDLIDQSVDMLKREKPDAVYIVGMGDMVERCEGNYPSQAFQTDLNEREQERFARRAIIALVKAVAPLTPRLVVSCVPGNHGEVRNGDGKAFTTPGDNADVAVFEQVMDALQEADAYDHVSFVIPNEDLTVVLDIAGMHIAFAHGHQFGGGANVQQKALNWWKGQAMGRLPPGDADALISGHYHHYQCLSTHGRLWMQCPSLDGGSRWFTDKTGEFSLPGTLTFRVTASGIRDVHIIAPE